MLWGFLFRVKRDYFIILNYEINGYRIFKREVMSNDKNSENRYNRVRS